MHQNIQTLAQLRLEIDRLTIAKEIHEKQISIYVKEYAQSLRPINLLKNAFNSVKEDSELKNAMKTKGIEAAIGFVVTQLLFKNASPFIRTAATVLGTSFATNLFGDDASGFMEKIKNLVQKFRSKKGVEPSERFNDEDLYAE